jgi:hypothetical protein
MAVARNVPKSMWRRSRFGFRNGSRVRARTVSNRPWSSLRHSQCSNLREGRWCAGGRTSSVIFIFFSAYTDHVLFIEMWISVYLRQFLQGTLRFYSSAVCLVRNYFINPWLNRIDFTNSHCLWYIYIFEKSLLIARLDQCFPTYFIHGTWTFSRNPLIRLINNMYKISRATDNCYNIIV